MTNITYRLMYRLWGQGWLPHTPTFLSPNSRRTPCHVPLSKPSYGGVTYDIFMIWTRSVQDLNTFTSFLNDIHPTIKFTCDYSFTSIPFLDVNVSLHNGIVTNLYTKPIDKHILTTFVMSWCLVCMGCHPIHTKRAIPFSLARSAAFVQPTRPSHSAPMNLLTIFTNVAITAISFNGNTAS